MKQMRVSTNYSKCFRHQINTKDYIWIRINTVIEILFHIFSELFAQIVVHLIAILRSLWKIQNFFTYYSHSMQRKSKYLSLITKVKFKYFYNPFCERKLKVKESSK